MTAPVTPPPDAAAARVDWRALAWVALPPLAVLVLRALLPVDVEGGALQRLHGATLVALEAIILGLAAADGPRALASLDRLNDLRASITGSRHDVG